VVTGGSRGLGKEMALALGLAGADLVIGARQTKPLEQTAVELAERTGRKVLPMPLDVAEVASVRAAVGRALEQFERIDIIVVDKTGTLTEGKPKMVSIVTADGTDETTLLRLAASIRWPWRS
jgi:NAD(P)-dependent dehydrogenase (short-subunit alcohol dehydrogenase family)